VSSKSIPIENIYYLLCYAWDRLEERDVARVAASPSARLQDLFARMLELGISHLLKRGIDRTYIPIEDEIPGIRGRLELATSIKRASFLRARAWCAYDELSPDVLHNRIIKTTLRRLAGVGGLDSELAESLRDLYRRMPEVREIALTGRIFRRVKIGRNIAYYGFLLDVCEIVHRNLLVHENTGEYVFRDFTRDDAQMANLFERFLYRFYQYEQRQYRVEAPHLTWDAEGAADDIALLPRMRTDLVLRGIRDTIVIDAKYYSEALGTYFGKASVRSDHLYQLHTYLRHVALNRDPRVTRGMLIYPRTTSSLSLSISIFGHPVTITALNLDQSWENIHNELLGLLTSAIPVTEESFAAQWSRPVRTL
jgi:5-methylcytosine-specific restriction enzyme subunit McrC